MISIKRLTANIILWSMAIGFSWLNIYMYHKFGKEWPEAVGIFVCTVVGILIFFKILWWAVVNSLPEDKGKNFDKRF